MDQNAYRVAFERYEDARSEYAYVQQEIREFLAQFTGEIAAHERAFAVRDMGRMIGLRDRRDHAYQLYTELERHIFDLLGAEWSENER